jgi:SAM-dependent methyltransferase
MARSSVHQMKLERETSPNSAALSRFGCWCGASDAVCLWSAKYNRTGAVDYTYSLLRCTNCGRVRTDPCPANGDTEPLYQGYGRSRLERESEVRRWFVSRLADIRRFAVPSARVLDVGCSIGTFVKMLKEVGYRAEGLEIDKYSAEQARAHGLEIHEGSLESAPLRGGFYDLIVMSHSLEHLPQLGSAIPIISRSLTNGGILLIYVPNFRSLAARAMRNSWGFLSPQEHVWHFTHMSLRNMAATLSAQHLRPVWIRQNTRLEPESANSVWKHQVKQLALRCASAVGYGDELRAAFRNEALESSSS